VGAAIASSAASRASGQRPSLAGQAASRGARLIGSLGLRNPRSGGAGILSLQGLPDVLRDTRAQMQRRPESQPGEVQRVLGQQATAGSLGNDSELTGQLPLLALGLVLLSSLLLVGAVLPPALVSRSPVSPERFAQFRQPLANAAMAFLLPVAFVALAAALS
jgi:hypothetical protein